MNSFFRELKQRKVYRVVLGYAVVAWLVVQISATIMPAYHAPEWILPISMGVGSAFQKLSKEKKQ
jgi:hypothetical protein